MLKKVLGFGLLAVVGVFVLMQLVPFGRNHANPPVVQEPSWDSAETRALAKRACFDCHSNETTWPWYSNIAPISWLVAHDVSEGRSAMNFSDWGQAAQRGQKVARQVERGAMPPPYYLPMHPTAQLTADERTQLISGLQKSLP
jgi:hypothetical protein